MHSPDNNNYDTITFVNESEKKSQEVIAISL